MFLNVLTEGYRLFRSGRFPAVSRRFAELASSPKPEILGV